MKINLSKLLSRKNYSDSHFSHGYFMEDLTVYFTSGATGSKWTVGAQINGAVNEKGEIPLRALENYIPGLAINSFQKLKLDAENADCLA